MAGLEVAHGLTVALRATLGRISSTRWSARVCWPRDATSSVQANQPKQFYRGGRAIAELRGLDSQDDSTEDWVASTTVRYGMDVDGLSRLPDGRYLRDAVEADPEAWLGPRHRAYFGSSPTLLVKLLDAGERLPVHVHPPRSFAYRHLGSRHGEAEAWVVLGASGRIR